MATPNPDTDFRNAVRYKMTRMVRREPQVGKSLLMALVSRGTLKEKQAVFNFRKKLDWDELNYNLQTGGITRPATPALKEPKYSRRVTTLKNRHVNIEANRIVGKFMGMTAAELANSLVPEFISGRARTKEAIILAFMRGTTFENPDLNKALSSTSSDPAHLKNIAFPTDNSYLPRARQIGSGSTYDARFDLDDLLELIAEADDAWGINAHGQGGVDGTIDSLKRVLIVNNKGWATINSTNKKYYANRDYFGKPVAIKGYGTIRMLHGTAVLTLNSAVFASMVAAPAAPYSDLGFDPTKSQAGLNPAEATSATGDYTVNGLHRGILLYPQTMHVTKSPQWDDSPQVKEDPAKSWEKSIYGALGMDGVRLFDIGVREIFFGREGQALKTKA